MTVPPPKVSDQFWKQKQGVLLSRFQGESQSWNTLWLAFLKVFFTPQPGSECTAASGSHPRRPGGGKRWVGYDSALLPISGSGFEQQHFSTGGGGGAQHAALRCCQCTHSAADAPNPEAQKSKSKCQNSERNWVRRMWKVSLVNTAMLLKDTDGRGGGSTTSSLNGGGGGLGWGCGDPHL